MTENGNEIITLKERLKEIQDEINALRSSIVSTGGTQTTSTDYKRLGREETNEQAEITSKEKKLNGILAKELLNLRNDVIKYENDNLNIEKLIENYKKN